MGPRDPAINPAGHRGRQHVSPTSCQTSKPPKSHMASWTCWELLLLLHTLGTPGKRGGEENPPPRPPLDLPPLGVRKDPLQAHPSPQQWAPPKPSSRFKGSLPGLHPPRLLNRLQSLLRKCLDHTESPGGRARGGWSFRSGTKRPRPLTSTPAFDLSPRAQARSRTGRWRPKVRGQRYQ